MKQIVFTLLIIVLNNQTFGQTLRNEKVIWYDYYWTGDSSNAKDAMMLNSKIDTVDFNFRWQFDTGSPRTFFYGNVWNSFCDAFPYLKSKFFNIDTFKSDGFINLKNGGVVISKNTLPKPILGLLPNYGSVVDKNIILENLGASTTIGTIGIDLFRDGVLIIDFKKNKIGYTDILSDQFYKEKQHTIDFTLYQNRIILPIKIGKKVFNFFYDSGASLFPLKSTAAFKAFDKMINYTDTLYNITTWGKSYNVPGGNIKEKIRIGKFKITQPKIYLHPDPDQFHTQIFKEAKVYGLIGNAFFENKIVVIDFTKMKFSIL